MVVDSHSAGLQRIIASMRSENGELIMVPMRLILILLFLNVLDIRYLYPDEGFGLLTLTVDF